MLWKYLIYLATESCQTVSCNSSCTSRRSSFFLGGLLRGRFQGWNRSQWCMVHRGGLRVDGAVPRVAVHNGPVGSCSSTVAGATQFGAPYAGVLKEILIASRVPPAQDGGPGSRLGGSWGGDLGGPGGVLGGSPRALGASWWRLGASWGRPGASWGRLGGVLGPLGASWGSLGAAWAV